MSVAALLGVAIVREEPVSGGDLSTVTRLTLADGCTVIAKTGGDARAEAAMLRALADAGAPAPAVLAHDETIVVMTALPADGGAAWDDLAAVLGRLHATIADSYGWAGDYASGPVVIENGRGGDWQRFWGDRRLLCHLPYLPVSLAARIERLAGRIAEHIPSRPPASLLHGDLWGGNILVSDGRVSGLIDPACYHGDREVDVAMLTLFDRPPDRFLDALALDPGYRERLPVYRLWPLLVHLRLFGAGYRARVEAELAKLGC